MAQEIPEVAAGNALVVDANILLRAVLGIRVRTLIERYAGRVTLLVPATCVMEVQQYLPELCAQRNWEAAPSLELLQTLLSGFHVIDSTLIHEFEQEAKRRIAARDPDDWPVVALALALNAPVWTEDTDFFGTGVATWTTATVELFLAGTT